MIREKNIVIIGDSFVQGVGDDENDGWTGIFKREFEWKSNIFIKGYGGNNIYDVLARIEKDLLPFQPSIVILQVGINDSRLRKSLGFSNEIKEEKFRKGLEEFVNRIKQSLKTTPYFIFIGITPVVDKLTTPYKEDKYYATAESRKYNKIIEDFCKSREMLFIGVFEKFMNVMNLEEILSDGVHPNSKGYKIIASAIITEFKRVFMDV